jgi:hypothetical protein
MDIKEILNTKRDEALAKLKEEARKIAGHAYGGSNQDDDSKEDEDLSPEEKKEKKAKQLAAKKKARGAPRKDGGFDDSGIKNFSFKKKEG